MEGASTVAYHLSMTRFITLFLGMLWIPMASYAASFDCRKAVSVVEKLICSDKTLSALDDELAEVYRMLRNDLDSEKVAALAEAQRSWIGKRNICKEDRACLKFSYDKRVSELRAFQMMGANAFILGSQAEDSDDSEPSRALILKCDYSHYKSFEYESVEIQVAEDRLADSATIKTFNRRGQSETHEFLVATGKLAECVYPSGTRVRVKVGEGNARAYGQCGADPEVFMTVWVNGRKVASREQFAGRCMEYDKDYERLSFKIVGGDKPIVKKCSTRMPAKGPAQRQQAPVTRCVDHLDLLKDPVDSLEYPPPGTKPLPTGAIELVTGHSEVCHVVQRELESAFFTFSGFPPFSRYPSETLLARPTWEDTAVTLPARLRGSRVSVFDFDNDGNLDRVFGLAHDSNYMHGTVLLVQPGSSPKTLSVSDNPIAASSLYLPCQMDKEQPAISGCPGFSQKADEAGYEIPGKPGGSSVFFRGRYTTVEPFFFQSKTYLGLAGHSLGVEEYVAIVKPLPGRKFRSICLFRQVPENF